MKISEFGIKYLLLALRIGKHNKDYVDYYIGPKELSDKVDREELVSPEKMLTDCNNLEKKLLVQGYDKQRERYLDKMLTAMRTSIEILEGVDIPFETQISKLYDVGLNPVNESELGILQKEVSEAFGGSGNLEKSFATMRERRKVPEPKVFTLFKEALKIVKDKTLEQSTSLLPQGEQVFVSLMPNKSDQEVKWTFYNRYLGNFCSQIEINPKYNMYWSSLLSGATHEAYPGHHTEFAVKESRLYRENNQFEHAILLMNSPQIVISEGIADIAVNILFTYQEQAEISQKYFSFNLTNDESIDILTLQNKVKGKIHLFWYNLTYLALNEGWKEEDLIQYALQFEIYNKSTIKNRIKLLNNNVFATISFIYKLGRDLIVNKFGEFPSIRNFKYLLENTILPSDLA
ncbi:MAG: hypothetical protein ACW986_02170 [Promethearchaeota archaeon]